MSALTKQHREDVLKGVLSAAFKPRFEEIIRQLTAFATASIAERHPHFVAAWKNEKIKPYLAVTFRPEIYAVVEGNDRIRSRRFAHPVYGRKREKPDTTWVDYETHGHKIEAKDVVGPSAGSESHVPVKHPLLKEYDATWADYTAAQTKLADLLNGYNSREKFEADFPEFAKYLPARVVKMALPAVIVKDVLRDLAKVGVPGSNLLSKGEAK